MNLTRIKHAIKTSPFFEVIHTYRQYAATGRWVHAGRPAPPPDLVKQSIVRSHAQQFGIKALVETGTFWGDMIWATRDVFASVYTIELDEELHRLAQKRFAREPKVRVLRGDSAVVLPEVLAELNEPAVFWLDGHYSHGITARGINGSPIELELEQISLHPIKGHVILIDDARCFVGADGYPTLDALREFVSERMRDYSYDVSEDVIRVRPQRA